MIKKLFTRHKDLKKTDKDFSIKSLEDNNPEIVNLKPGSPGGPAIKAP